MLCAIKKVTKFVLERKSFGLRKKKTFVLKAGSGLCRNAHNA